MDREKLAELRVELESAARELIAASDATGGFTAFGGKDAFFAACESEAKVRRILSALEQQPEQAAA